MTLSCTCLIHQSLAEDDAVLQLMPSSWWHFRWWRSRWTLFICIYYIRRDNSTLRGPPPSKTLFQEENNLKADMSVFILFLKCSFNIWRGNMQHTTTYTLYPDSLCWGRDCIDPRSQQGYLCATRNPVYNLYSDFQINVWTRSGENGVCISKVKKNQDTQQQGI